MHGLYVSVFIRRKNTSNDGSEGKSWKYTNKIDGAIMRLNF